MARHTAAAVPASKVEIGGVYAIKHNDNLVRFRVTAVVTRREAAHGNPHDYKSTVEGYVFGPDSGGKEAALTLQPDALLGLYTEYVELVAREKAEKAKREAAEQLAADRTKRLWTALYEAAGIEPPEGDRDYGVAFRLGYGRTSIEIADKGVEPLLAFFERVKQSA